MPVPYRADQLNVLKEYFQFSQYLQIKDEGRLCEETSLNEIQIKNWFKNKRRKLSKLDKARSPEHTKRPLFEVIKVKDAAVKKPKFEVIYADERAPGHSLHNQPATTNGHFHNGLPSVTGSGMPNCDEQLTISKQRSCGGTVFFEPSSIELIDMPAQRVEPPITLKPEMFDEKEIDMLIDSVMPDPLSSKPTQLENAQNSPPVKVVQIPIPGSDASRRPSNDIDHFYQDFLLNYYR